MTTTSRSGSSPRVTRGCRRFVLLLLLPIVGFGGRPDDAWAVDWIGIGGGSEPESNQVSLEQDLALARQVLGSPAALLFAGGPTVSAVQVLRGRAVADPLMGDLGDFFDPRDGRRGLYRRTTLRPNGAATADNARGVIERRVRVGSDPLLIYVATHGERADRIRDTAVLLWGGGAMTAADLAALLDEAPPERRVRVVITACYSGGFAEVAFAGADPEAGAPRGDRCGLFAATADEMASGCDPNPDRGSQEGYGLHFLHALRGEDARGRPVATGEIDTDGDGRISLLEAHTRARIASVGLDIPTSTSERWLRAVAPAAGPEVEAPLAEEDAVTIRLGRRLSLPDEARALARLGALSNALRVADDELAQAEDVAEDAAARLRIAALEQWPVLDDPWHPDFPATLAAHRAAIRAFFGGSEQARRVRHARALVERHGRRYDDLKVEVAAVTRVARAYETRRLARRLRAAGGPAWDQYARLLACERSFP